MDSEPVDEMAAKWVVGMVAELAISEAEEMAELWDGSTAEWKVAEKVE